MFDAAQWPKPQNMARGIWSTATWPTEAKIRLRIGVSRRPWLRNTRIRKGVCLECAQAAQVLQGVFNRLRLGRVDSLRQEVGWPPEVQQIDLCDNEVYDATRRNGTVRVNECSET